jgi:hypothetical protein
MDRDFGGGLRKSEGKKSLGRPICTWKDNIRKDCREIKYCGFKIC